MKNLIKISFITTNISSFAMNYNAKINNNANINNITDVNKTRNNTKNIDKIRSKIITKIVFDFLKESKKINLIKYNKKNYDKLGYGEKLKDYLKSNYNKLEFNFKIISIFKKDKHYNVINLEESMLKNLKLKYVIKEEYLSEASKEEDITIDIEYPFSMQLYYENNFDNENNFDFNINNIFSNNFKVVCKGYIIEYGIKYICSYKIKALAWIIMIYLDAPFENKFMVFSNSNNRIFDYYCCKYINGKKDEDGTLRFPQAFFVKNESEGYPELMKEIGEWVELVNINGIDYVRKNGIAPLKTINYEIIPFKLINPYYPEYKKRTNQK